MTFKFNYELRKEKKMNIDIFFLRLNPRHNHIYIIINIYLMKIYEKKVF